MADPSGKLVIVHNGEIFNYQALRKEIEATGEWIFRSQGDTEVVLAGYALWGTSVLERLNGMFAFAIADTRRGFEVFMARDRFGKKPLYFCQEPSGEFLLSSEWRGIRAGRRKTLDIDPVGLVGVLTEYGTPAPVSIERDVRRLSAGTWALWTPSGFSTTRWYTPSLPRLNRRRDGLGDPEIESTVECALREAVSSRMVADVPVAAFLSSGVDSAMVVALAQAVSGRRLATYTVGHGGAGDERLLARATATALESDHHEVMLSGTPHEIVAEGIQAMDEPTADGAFFATFQLAKLTARDVKVVLTGEGSDEMFGGYGHYAREARWGWIFDAPLPLRRTARKGMAAAARFLRWSRLGELARHLETGPDRCGGRWAQAWDVNSALALLEDKARSEVIERYDSLFPARAFAMTARSISSRPARAQWLDQVTLLPEYLLQKIDRATMAHGLEARTPYLDHRLSETLAQYPWSTWATPVGEKPLLRRIAQRYLPREIVSRPKLGFSAPTRQWLETLAVEGVLGTDASRSRINTLSGYEAKKLWVFAVLQLWLARWGVEDVIAHSPWKALGVT
jgi:asparagine synthase (glutamine-hydrolysing)